MNHLVYKITNLINGKIYIGIHSTEDINDLYMGSGVNIKKSIARHGVENFKKEILYNFDNYDDMIAMEIKLVNEEFILRTDTYNAALGGYGAPYKMEHRHDSEEIRAKISAGTKAGMTTESKKKISNAQKKSVKSESSNAKRSESMKNYIKLNGHHLTGTKISDAHKEAIGASRRGKKTPVNICVKGEFYTQYEDAASVHGVSPRTIRNWVKDELNLECYLV